MTEKERKEKHAAMLAHWLDNNYVDVSQVQFDENGNTIPPGQKYHYMNKPYGKLTAKQKDEFYGKID